MKEHYEILTQPPSFFRGDDDGVPAEAIGVEEGQGYRAGGLRRRPRRHPTPGSVLVAQIWGEVISSVWWRTKGTCACTQCTKEGGGEGHRRGRAGV